MDKYIPRDKSEFQLLQQYEREMQSYFSRASLFTQAFLSLRRLFWYSLSDSLNPMATAKPFFICTARP